MAGGATAGEVTDPGGVRVVLPLAVWRDKLLRDHPELALHLADVLRAVASPDHLAPDPVFGRRQRFYCAVLAPAAGRSRS